MVFVGGAVFLWYFFANYQFIHSADFITSGRKDFGDDNIIGLSLAGLLVVGLGAAILRKKKDEFYLVMILLTTLAIVIWLGRTLLSGGMMYGLG